MYQSYDAMDPVTIWPRALPRIEQAPAFLVAGAQPVEVSSSALQGMWTLRFGRFGCPDGETRGGVSFLAGDSLMGGDNNFAYRGSWSLDGTELTATIDILRHGTDPELQTLFGTLENAYQLECIAEAITPDLIEGRLRRPGHPDARIVMRRLRGSTGGDC